MVTENRDTLKIGELPHLKIVAVEDILFHEEPDGERVVKLMDKFRADGVLRNPPVVASVHSKPRSILLDGANRITALKQLGFKDVLVQEIDFYDSGLILSQWHHAVEKLGKGYLLERLGEIHGLTVKEWIPSGQNVPEGGLARVTFRDRTIFGLCASGDVFKKVALLKQITDLYKGFAYMDRVSYTNLEHLEKNYARFSALVSFREFAKDEILELTDNSIKIPSGITRVLLPKRALYFNIHLDILKSKLSVVEKNRWLAQRIAQKIADKSIRFYQEPTFFFDE